MITPEQTRLEQELLLLRLVISRFKDPRDGGVLRSELIGALRFIQTSQYGLVSIASTWERAELSRTWGDALEMAEAALRAQPEESRRFALEQLALPLSAEELGQAWKALETIQLEGAKNRLNQAVGDAQSLPEALERVRREGTRLRREEPPKLQELLQTAIERDSCADQSGFPLRADLMEDTGATWCNSWAGPTGRFTAGSTVLIGGASSSGKTTIANVFALSALDAKLPVFFYQAELDPARHLRDLYLLHNKRDRKGRLEATTTLPDHWIWQEGRDREDLLRYPSLHSDLRQKSNLLASLEAWADGWERRLGAASNACKGVVILDYIQLIRDESARSDYTALEAVASELAQLAASRALVVVILSQVSKGDQKEIGRALSDAMTPPKEGKSDHRAQEVLRVLESNAETFFAGADIRRVADVAFALVPIPGSENQYGNRLRTLVLSKERGNSWGSFFEGGKRVLSFRMESSGTLTETNYGVKGLPAPEGQTWTPTVFPPKQSRGVPSFEEEVP